MVNYEFVEFFSLHPIQQGTKILSSFGGGARRAEED